MALFFCLCLPKIAARLSTGFGTWKYPDRADILGLVNQTNENLQYKQIPQCLRVQLLGNQLGVRVYRVECYPYERSCSNTVTTSYCKVVFAMFDSEELK